MKALEEIAQHVDELAARIAAPARALPTFGRTEDGARPHVEVHGGTYHYVVVERGCEQSRRRTPVLDELLYWIFDDVTHQLAFAHELHHRIAGQDCRRLAFATQLALMGRIDAAFAQRLAARIADVLRRHPYDDARFRAS